MINRYKFGSELRTWETSVMRCEIEFKKLQAQSDYSTNVDPLYYTGMLWLGILSILLTSNWLVVIAFNSLKYWLGEKVGNFDLASKDQMNKLLSYCEE